MKNILQLFICVFCLLSMSTLNAQEAPKIHKLADFQSQAFPSNVTVYDLDGNSPSTNPKALKNKTWAVARYSGFNYVAVSTSYFASSGLQADDWMIFQDVVLDTSSLKSLLVFKAQSIHPSFLETMEILVDDGNSVIVDSFELIKKIDPVRAGELTQYSIDITEYAGDTISIAFRNVSIDKYYLVVDDVSIISIKSEYYATLHEAYNITYASVDVDKTFYQDLENYGINVIEDLTYLVTSDSGDTAEIVIDGLNINPLFSSSAAIDIPADFLTAPLTTIGIRLIKINGVELNYPGIEITYSVVSSGAAADRLPLNEMFTSSSCPPCKPGNEKYQDILDNQMAQKVHYIKYQQNFPGDGDPYTTDEIIARRNYYNVNAVPNLNVDGSVYDVNPNGMNAADLRATFLHPGFVKFDDVTYEIDSHTVVISGTYTILSAVLPNTKLMVAISEDTTYNNVTTNGETKFMHVVKKLVGGVEGITIDPSTPLNEPQEFEMSYTFKGNYRLPIDGTPANRIKNSIEHSVEEFSDLIASVWIENQNIRYVLNSVEATLLDPTATNQAELIVNDMRAYPSPAQANTQVDILLNEAVSADVNIVTMNGERINIFSGRLHSGKNTINADVSDLPAGRYIVELRGKNLYNGIPLIVIH